MMTAENHRRLLAVVFCAGVVFGLDQAAKQIVQNRLGYGQRKAVVECCFHLTHTRNRGAAFGLFSERSEIGNAVFAVASLAGIAAIGFMLFSAARQSISETAILSVILGGALGNLKDRWLEGSVVDFIDLHFAGHHWHTFNVADIGITVGIFLLLIRSFRGHKTSRAGANTLLAATMYSLSGCGTEVPPIEPLPVQSWSLVEDTIEPIGVHSQGLASVPALGPNEFIFTSRISIDRANSGGVAVSRFGFAPDLSRLEFDHMGDPDAHERVVYVGLEDNSEPSVHLYHRGFAAFDIDSLELLGWAEDIGNPNVEGDGDAPWVAVSPDGRWLVTSEWDPMKWLIVYRTVEILKAHTIVPAGTIPIENSPGRIQGCDFDGPRLLICASDDADTGRLVYSLRLSSPLQGNRLPQAATAKVEPLFPAPSPAPRCEFDVEVEGVDVDGDTLRVLVIGTCLDSHLYRYVRTMG